MPAKTETYRKSDPKTWVIGAGLKLNRTVRHRAGDICEAWIERNEWNGGSLYRIKTIKYFRGGKIEGTLTGIRGGRAIKFSTDNGDELYPVVVDIDARCLGERFENDVGF